MLQFFTLTREALMRAVLLFFDLDLDSTWISEISWAREQLGCLVVHHLERWLHQTTAYSIPHHYGWLVEDVLEWFWPSCCHEQHFLPIPTPQLPSTPSLQPGRLVHQHQPSWHNDPCASGGGFFPLGTGVQHETSESCSFPSTFLLYHVQTLLNKFARASTKLVKNIIRILIYGPNG